MASQHDIPEIFDKFNETARRVLMTSQKIAQSTNSAADTQHLLLALSITGGTIAYNILQEHLITVDQIRLIMSLHEIKTHTKVGISSDLRRILLKSVKKASEYKHITIDSEHLLLSITRDDKCFGYKLIERLGVEPSAIKEQLEHYFEELNNIDEFIVSQASSNHFAGDNIEMPTPQNDPSRTKDNKSTSTPALDYFTTDLTKDARDGKLDPIIGREKEITRVIQILCRRNKNNAVLIGEPGVGKTAIVEGLAQRIATNKVPLMLQGKRIAQLDLALVVAGTTYRGQFEDRVKKIVDEITKNKNIILFIDELHTVVGAGSAEGSLDLANIIKPALAKGLIHLVGATTIEEYRKHIEKDAALERRLQPIIVEEPSEEEAIAILRGIKKQYENHHDVIIHDEAILASVKMSKRYISDRQLPDKAIDLIDEASAATQLDTAKKDRIETKIQSLEKEISEIKKQKEQEVDNENYEKAMTLKTTELRLQKELDELKSKTKGHPQKRTIQNEDIAHIVSQWTGIPVTNLIKDEKVRLLNLESTLRNSIVGQDEAIITISKAIRRSKAGISDNKRPLGSFMFLGPTGVGKTELAKVLAEQVYNREDALIKVDMSEFMERHNISRLVGAPPGYVGYEEAGRLTETVRKKPYSVILFDEIEKAHPEVFNILLQILEDGYLTDAKGKKVNFRNTIIIMTSNIGMSEFNKNAAIGFQADKDEKATIDAQYEEMKKQITSRLKDTFRPEFLNRLDKIVVFKPLGKDDIRKIVDIQIEKLTERLKADGINIAVKNSARDYIAEIGFDAEFGARPIRRAIIENIEDPLSEALLSGQFKEGQTINILKKTNKIIFQK
ncbi:MAG: ATP-dependent Clp protease ATP-binding subunit [bacterium]|nr:ATP-dependent Clp protease ATP-binding subunit [bacterium]